MSPSAELYSSLMNFLMALALDEPMSDRVATDVLIPRWFFQAARGWTALASSSAAMMIIRPGSGITSYLAARSSP